LINAIGGDGGEQAGLPRGVQEPALSGDNAVVLRLQVPGVDFQDMRPYAPEIEEAVASGLDAKKDCGEKAD
jgi:hypothetical protein